MDVRKIINTVKVEMYGHDVGDEATGVYGHKPDQEPVVIVEKKKGIVAGLFSYLVVGKTNPNYIGHAQSYKDGTVLIDNARIVGSDDPSLGVRTEAEARAQVWS
jgi:hypothetical protein